MVVAEVDDAFEVDVTVNNDVSGGSMLDDDIVVE